MIESIKTCYNFFCARGEQVFSKWCSLDQKVLQMSKEKHFFHLFRSVLRKIVSTVCFVFSFKRNRWQISVRFLQRNLTLTFCRPLSSFLSVVDKSCPGKTSYRLSHFERKKHDSLQIWCLKWCYCWWDFFSKTQHHWIRKRTDLSLFLLFSYNES